MSHADFETIPATVCRLKSLKSFTSKNSPNLGRNNGSIFDDCNHITTKFTILSLQHDQLTTIQKLSHIFPSLQTLNLYDNKLHFIESSSFAGLTSLTALNLGYSNLTSIPFAVNMAINLRELWVHSNRIYHHATSPCNEYSPYTQLLYSKTGVYRGIHFFLFLL